MVKLDRVDNEKEIYYVIHRNGKRCELHTTKNIKILLDACHKNNEYFGEKPTKITKIGKVNTIENADKIMREFDSHFKKKKQNKLVVIKENINKTLKDKTKLIRRMPTRGKVYISASLAATLGISGMAISGAIKSSEKTPVYTPLATIEEMPEYIDDFEDVEMSSPDENIYDNLNDIIVNYDSDFNIDDEKVTIDEPIEIENNELEQMMQPDEFHFSYKDRTDSESLSNAKRYEDLFTKYGNMYGVDPRLLMAIATQESSGDHYSHLSGGAAMGIMQIEKSVWIGHSVSAYNFETGEKDKINITHEALEDLETNIQIGTMIWRNRIEANNYNIALGTQEYNFGPGNMDKVFASFNYDTGITKSDLKEDYSNTKWMEYRNVVHVGDPLYVEHVFSYLEDGTVLKTRTLDDGVIEIKIVNDQVNEKQMA